MHLTLVSLYQLVDAAIKKSELGLNPQIEGQLIRLPIPDLSEERRNEIIQGELIWWLMVFRIRRMKQKLNFQYREMICYLESRRIAHEDKLRIQEMANLLFN